MTRHATRTLGLGLTLSALLMMAQGAGAAGAVTVGGTSRSGDILNVTGTATFTDQPFVVVGTDETADTLVPGQDQIGQDLTATSISSLANGGLALRWTVTTLPPANAPGIVYGWTFCVEMTCYEVDASLMNPGSGGETLGNVWRCADGACYQGDQTLIDSTIRPTVDTAAKTITMSLTASLLGLAPGVKIIPVTLSTMGPAFSGNGDLGLANYFYNTGDGVLAIEDFTLAGKQVSVAVATAGLDPASLTYTSSVSPAGNGAYDASVDVSGKSGEHAVYVRACLGAGNCAYATQAVTL